MSTPFTKEMKKDYTILIPNMSPIHFNIAKEVFSNHGYNVALLDNQGPNVIREGLRYVHNDICYPAQLVIGQFIDAIKHGGYDSDKVALVITQTGGGCRASNYIFLLRKALEKCNLSQIPVISLNLKGMEKNPGFKITPFMLLQTYSAFIYGDLLMALSNQIRPYEVHKGEADALVAKWTAYLSDCFAHNRGYIGWAMKRNLNRICAEFAEIERREEVRIKVGIVGEIYMKYSPLGNNHLQEYLEEQGCEVMVPSMMGFLYYGIDNAITDRKYYGGRFISANATQYILRLMYKVEKMSRQAMMKSGKFTVPIPYTEMKKLDEGLIDYGVKMGEGWLLTAEMLDLVHSGYHNIVCAQPFGCLPNHICAKGMIRAVTERSKDANIVPIDYDPSATGVNQENRIKLMLAIAREKLENPKGNI
ncbi:2-hydroxyacyl-CoA dehydratase [Sphaerochaeta halotolerans]|uniref:2-hydroxyacyl-CoA dehydratase n=1 Tax=Sphaerochaeta halotolerans TaxID=2293840 RepID=UPI00136E2584|nr:2-hydroxyacyl-CoA dehydratase [Sphaerochaeta halotolerans]MXI86259.1 2-hydroxyglutaryl-CoA dehydratase [Sphaerochaeta halotolerans]